MGKELSAGEGGAGGGGNLEVGGSDLGGRRGRR